MNKILVFKTNLTNKKKVEGAKRAIEKIPGIIQWNVDIQDCDKILRIETLDLSAKTIEKHLLLSGFLCEELI